MSLIISRDEDGTAFYPKPSLYIDLLTPSLFMISTLWPPSGRYMPRQDKYKKKRLQKGK